MVGSGSPTRPYLIGQEGGGNPLQNLDVVDDPTLDLTITGDGTVVDKRLISGKATQSMTNLKDVRPSQVLVEGDIPFWRTDHWEFEPAGTSLPPGGTDGQVLTKQSSTSGDANWETPAAGGSGGAVLEPTYSSSRGSNVAQSIPNGSWTQVDLSTVIYEDGIVWNDPLLPGLQYRIPVDGYYQVDACIGFAATGTTGYRAGAIYLNSTPQESYGIPAQAVTSNSINLSATFKATAGQYVTVRAWQNSGAAVLLTGSQTQNFLAITKVPTLSPGGGGVVVERPITTSRQHATPINAASAALTNIPWDTAQADDGSIPCSSGVFTIPVDGWYQVNAKVTFNASTTGMRSMRVMRNGASADLGTVQVATAIGGNATTVQYARALKLAAGDTISVNANHTAGANLDVAYGGIAYNSIDITKMPQSFSGSAVSTYGERNYSARRGFSAPVSIANNTDVPVNFDTSYSDDGITWNGTAFVIPVAGFYDVNVLLGYTVNTTGVRQAKILQNGSSGTYLNAAAGTSGTGAAYSRTYKCAAGDTISVTTLQNSGAALNLSFAAIDITKVPAPVINGAAASGVWGVGPLAPALVGSDDLAGREVYIDSKGQLRAKPEVPAPRTLRRKTATTTLTTASTFYTIPYETDDEPGGSVGITHNNGVFTVPTAGVYQINVMVLINGVTGTNQVRSRIIAAGASVSESTGSGNTTLAHSRSVRLAAGDTVYTEAFCVNAAATVPGSTVKYSMIDITRISA